MRLAVLVSGTGSIMEAMINQGLPIDLVLSDRPCRGIDVAAAAGVPTLTIDRRDFGFKLGQPWDREGFTDAVTKALQDHKVDLVALSGFMTVFSPSFLDHFPDRVLNTHPALLPAFPGDGHVVIKQTLAAGVKVTGCTVHLVTPEVDAGRILAQEPVRVEPGDTKDTLWERIKTAERQLYPATIRQYLDQLPSS
jgi:phosphoribosylglycinamide formyltransferase-1